MTVISKFAGNSLPYNCYEVAHTWTPSCNDAALILGWAPFCNSIKFYSVMYLALQILRKKFSAKEFLDSALSILASSSFLGFHGFGFASIFCLQRKLFGRIHFLSAFTSGFIACFLALLIEREHRRGPLALYTANCASDILFRMAVARGYIKPLPHGDVALFCAAISIYCYITRKRGFPKDAVGFVIKYLIGNEEIQKKNASRTDKDNDVQPVSTSSSHNVKNLRITKNIKDSSLFVKLQRYMETKHRCCPHNSGCAQYSIQGFLRPFAIGCSFSLGIQLLYGMKSLLTRPSQAFYNLNFKECLRTGLFLGGFTWTYRVINCILRWFYNKNKAEYALPAAFIGGLFMKFSPNTSLALYLLWKTIEVLCDIGIERGIVPKIPGFMLLLYALSGALSIHVVILEPQNMRPSFRNFIIEYSGNKLAEINRKILDRCGTHASKLYSDFWPNLDPRFVSRAFQETVLIWLIH